MMTDIFHKLKDGFTQEELDAIFEEFKGKSTVPFSST
jgi:hypothetical protein